MCLPSSQHFTTNKPGLRDAYHKPPNSRHIPQTLTSHQNGPGITTDQAICHQGKTWSTSEKATRSRTRWLIGLSAQEGLSHYHTSSAASLEVRQPFIQEVSCRATPVKVLRYVGQARYQRPSMERGFMQGHDGHSITIRIPRRTRVCQICSGAYCTLSSRALRSPKHPTILPPRACYVLWFGKVTYQEVGQEWKDIPLFDCLRSIIKRDATNSSGVNRRHVKVECLTERDVKYLTTAWDDYAEMDHHMALVPSAEEAFAWWQRDQRLRRPELRALTAAIVMEVQSQ